MFVHQIHELSSLELVHVYWKYMSRRVKIGGRR